ncbi:cytochrome P450 [Jimgerdemannia flammicorona]|uniref:Cytochrome P450 n=1 Tax=Jimgerdemannia flammicorona TaxID=994334 RepID=A0A433DC14_9FUNG|nr:cytochrome P450 [Jimgerdemannia flammicorona]
MTDALTTLSVDWCTGRNGIFVIAAAAAVVTGVFVANHLNPADKDAERFKKLAKLPSPPGAVPILGHLLVVGTSPHLKFSEWGKTLGPIFAVKMGSSRTWVVHNSPDVVRDILDRRGATFSDRVQTHLLEAISGNGDMFFMSANGPYLRAWRKHTNNTISKTRLEKDYSNIFKSETKRLLLNLLERGNVGPEGIDPFDDVYLYVINVISLIVFGKNFTKDDADYRQVLQITIDFIQVGSKVLEEFFPFLSPLYRGAIGRAAKVQFEIQQVFGRFVDEVKQDMKEGNERNCACNEYLKAQETDEEGHLYDKASADTSAIALLGGMSMLARQPEIQDRAFAEIKANIGLDRLPNDMDESSLPYTNAIITELLRFRPPSWFGIPHSNLYDEEYNGYHIPANSAHVINVHGLHFDPDTYPDPYAFKPERHLDADNTRQHYAFGAGRRICPGAFLAEKLIFTTLARLLWAFRIEPSLDAQRNPVEVPMPDITKPTPIPPRINVRFVPRHDNVERLCRA